MANQCSRIASLIVVVLIQVVLSVRQQTVEATAGPIKAADKLLAFLNQAVPSLSIGERSEFRSLVLRDLEEKTNDVSFDSSSQQIIERAGFEQETHHVKAQDGYITELIHIINPLVDRNDLKRPPVALFHGGIIDTNCFIWGSINKHHPEKYPRNMRDDGPITSSNRSVAFMLANHGYDVWLVGTRGSNKQNIGHELFQAEFLEDLLKQHNWLEPSDVIGRHFVDTLKYLEFSQDEVVEFEYPKQIDTILSLTNSKKLSAITYSLSTQMLFKLLASDRIHAKRIHSHVAIAPLLNNKGQTRMMKMVSELATHIPNPVGNILFTQVMLTGFMRRMTLLMDRYTVIYYLTSMLCGSTPRYQTFLETPVIGHLFKPFAFKMAKHLAQQVNACQLQKYDYGERQNRFVYGGSAQPPVYNISNISLKRWMMVSAENDILSTPDSAGQYYKLHQHKPDRWIKVAKFNHADLAAAVDNDVKVNLPILEFMEKFKLPKIDAKFASHA